jgi:signal transduction histidine kinase
VGATRDRAVLAVAVAVCVAVAVITSEGSESHLAWLEAVARVLMVAVPIAVGLYAWRRPPFERFGTLLVVTGFAWSLTTLAGSQDAVLYSVGRVSAWVVEVWVVYVVLAFPSGRLHGRTDVALVGAIALVMVALYLPSALLVDDYPVPTAWTTCSADCPPNAFMVVGSEPAFVGDVMQPLREALTVLIFVGVAVRLAMRIGAATRITRRTLEAVLAVAILRLLAYAAAIVTRALEPDGRWIQVWGWLIALAVPMTAVAFLVGMVQWQLFIARASGRLGARLGAHPEPEDLRVALADAFDDPSLEIVYRVGDGNGHWADAAGRPVTVPGPESDRCLTEVCDGGERVAALIHDPTLRHERAFIDSATSYLVMALDNHRLAARGEALLREVRESRARIQATADQERRRIERDLHDGAQQRLVAMRIKLELVAERLDGADPAHARLLHRIGTEIEEAIEEVRSLARGVYPAALTDRGLVEALRAGALRAALPTTVLASGVGRYPTEVESAAYFCCTEAMQNAAKHAEGATVVHVELSEVDAVLRCEVRDDGPGFDPHDVQPRTGLMSMRDRLAAVGGELEIVSSAGRGTTVRATIPVRRSVAAR